MRMVAVCAALLTLGVAWLVAPGPFAKLTNTEAASLVGGPPVPDNPLQGPGGPPGNSCSPVSGVVCALCTTGTLGCGFNGAGLCVETIAGGTSGNTLGSTFWNCAPSGDPVTTCKAASGTGNTWCGFIANPNCVRGTDPSTGLPTCTPQCVPTATPASVCSNQTG